MEIHIFKGHQCPQAKGLCVVIDVLRAFTTAAFAFHSGAEEILLVSTIEDALQRHQQDPSLILMGEQEGKRIEGFHFENSPSEMKKISLKGKKLVQRTSSGTQGVVGCRHAPVKRIQMLSPSCVSFIATGRTNGDEDLALAEYLQCRLKGERIDLEPFLSRVKSSQAAQRMLTGEISYPLGQTDLELATQVDLFPFAMEVNKKGEELIAQAVLIPA
jgi:2-phosphosulfolactate phosphatase